MLASLAQLDKSHRRHDEVMTGLLAAARRLAAGRPDDGDAMIVRDAIGYFERAVKRHFLDEEGSVFPRLSTRRPELAEALAALSAEHPAQIALQNAIADAAKQLDGGEARQNAGKLILEIAEKLEAQHRAHVQREDELFRTAQEALTEEDDREIVSEMEHRRGREGGGRGEGRGRAKGGDGRGKGKNGEGRGKGKNGEGRRKKTAALTKKAKPIAAKKTKPKAKRATRARAR